MDSLLCDSATRSGRDQTRAVCLFSKQHGVKKLHEQFAQFKGSPQGESFIASYGLSNLDEDFLLLLESGNGSDGFLKFLEMMYKEDLTKYSQYMYSRLVLLDLQPEELEDIQQNKLCVQEEFIMKLLHDGNINRLYECLIQLWVERNHPFIRRVSTIRTNRSNPFGILFSLSALSSAPSFTIDINLFFATRELERSALNGSSHYLMNILPA